MESETGIYEMVDISASEVIRLIDFFYTMDYQEDPYDVEQPEEPRTSSLQLHAQMFALGDRYDIPSLRTLAVHRYEKVCSQERNTLDFLESIPQVYGTTPSALRGLRDIVIDFSRRHLIDPDARAFSSEAVAIRNRVIDECTEHSQDLLRSFLTNPVLSHCSTCHGMRGMTILQARCRDCLKGQHVARP